MLPQLLYIILSAIGLGIAMEQHGKIQERKYNFIKTIIASIIIYIILFWGGFFDVFWK